MRVLFTIAIRNLWKASRRTLLLSIAIAGVTFFLVLLLSLTEGIRANVIRSATTLFSGDVNVTGFYKPTASQSEPVTLEVERIKKIIRDRIDGVDQINDRVQGIGQIISGTESVVSLIMGIDLNDEKTFEEVVELARVSEYKPEGGDLVKGNIQSIQRPDRALLFADQAERLEVEVGDPITIRAETFGGVSNTVDLTVGAIVRDIGLFSNFAIFAPRKTIKQLYQLREDASGLVMIYLDDRSRSEEVMGRLRRELENADYEVMEHDPWPIYQKFETTRNSDWTGYRLDLTTWEDQISFVSWILTAVNTVSVFIVLVLTVLIAVGMINTMVMSIRDRTSEIGTMRAIGLSRAGVLGLFLLEALILGFAASVVGAAAGAATALGIDALSIQIPIEAVQAILLSDELNLAPRLLHVALSIAGLTLFVGIAALWPSLQAARLEPVDAIHRAR